MNAKDANDDTSGTFTGAAERHVTGHADQGAGYWVDLGGRLRRAREYLGFSQQYVAERMGVPRTAISDIERGARKVDSLELRKFSRLFRYPVARLLDEEPSDETGNEPGSDDTVRALARTMTDLTAEDLKEVSKFADFLRFSSMREDPQR